MEQTNNFRPEPYILGVKRGYFGYNKGEKETAYTKANGGGILYIQDLSTGGYGFYVIANNIPKIQSSLYNDNESNYSVYKSGDSIVIERTRDVSLSYPALQYVAVLLP